MADLKRLFPGEVREDEEGRSRLLEFLSGFERPKLILAGVRKLLTLGDPLVAPPKTFLRRRLDPQFEKWDFPVNLYTLIETGHGRLLSLPPGSKRFATYRALIPDVVDLHIHVRFPRLLAELANRPNLFFPGVYFPQEFEISNMEMISAMHGTFYVVHAELWVGGRTSVVSVVLKPTDMALESILTFILQVVNRKLDPAVRQKIGSLLAPTIVAIDDVYGILELIPGKNGVEFLPRGIKTGTILELRSNEYPADLQLTREETLQVAREFAKQAVMAYYLRLYDRKPDQIMIHRAADGTLAFAHIDFGRALKRNYALPWKRHYDPSRPALTFQIHEIPYFESAAAFIYLLHFIPAAYRLELSPFEGIMRKTIVETFELLAREIKSDAEDIHSLLKYAIGLKTQYRPTEVDSVFVEPADVEEIHRSLLAIENPRDIIESILNMAYHEREGTTAIRAEDDGGVYRRALMLGDRATALTDKTDEPYPYRLADYRKCGRISYDSEQKILKVEFGDDPEAVIGNIDRNFSRRLAKDIRQFPGNVCGVELEISADGEVVARMKEAGSGLLRRLRFSPDIMREINEAASGFSPALHVLARVAEFQELIKPPDDLQLEIARQRSVIANDLEGREILQFYMALEPEESPFRAAMAEMILYLIANPDFLADKDPYESINQLVLSLARKHLRARRPGTEFFSPELLKEENFVESVLKHYDRVDTSHLAHLVLTVRFAEELGRRADLPPQEMKMLRICSLLHDLNVLDETFREVLMEPSGRLSRPVITALLDRHAEISARILKKHLEDGSIVLPAGIAAEETRKILTNHHQEFDGPHGRLQQILHLADNIAVFSDRTRPDHWNRGFFRLEDIAPRWIDAQLERAQIERGIWSAAQGFFSDPANHVLLRKLDRLSIFYPQCYSALQMAAALHLGLNPQHPTPLADLRDRHGAELVDRIFDNLMKSGLSVRDKIKVINRIDSISSLFRPKNARTFAFINAGAQPVQRVVELIMRFVAEGRSVILMGVLQRVIKTYERFRVRYPDLERVRREQVTVIAGVRRLQFVTHAYPIEADFQMPFHKIIRDFRDQHQVQDPCCLIPFERFMESYGPTGDPEARIRKLEKASDVEEVAASDRVKAEADRFLKWEKSRKNLNYDSRGKERFRRILLGGFANRDVLLFYEATLDRDPAVKKALREVIGALHENPNFLSDRSVYYSVQELVRSLGQIHFYGSDTPPGIPEARAFLQEQGLSACADLLSILDTLKPQFNFVKQNLTAGLRIAVALGRLWEKSGGAKFSDESWRLLSAGVLASGAILEDEAISDYVLSPEDISSNRTLRRLLMAAPVSMPGLIPKLIKHSSMTSKERRRLAGLFEDRQMEPEDAILFLLIQSGLLFAAFCDFSRVENWKRGKVLIVAEDLEHLWELLEKEFRRLKHLPAGAGLQKFGQMVKNFCRTAGPGLLNSLAEHTHSYVRLYNSLSLAAELRYGLKARGFDLFHNVRTLYGTHVTELLTEAITEANFPPRDKVKFARKLRLLAQAITAETSMPAHLRFIHTDDPLGFPAVTDMRGVLQERKSVHFVPAGDFERTQRLLAEMKERVGPEEFQKILGMTRLLVGEDYPLLIKEKTLQMSDEFRKRINAYRRRHHLSARHIFVPIEELLTETSTPPPEPASPHPADKGLFFFRTWMRLFDA